MIRRLTGILIAFAIFAAVGTRAEELGIVTADNLNLRPVPGTHQPPLAQLEKGAEVVILEQVEGWLKIRHKDRVGYIQNREVYVHLVSPNGKEPHAKEIAGSGSKIERFQREVESLNRKIRAAEDKVGQYSAEEEKVIENLNNLQYEIHKNRGRIEANRNEIRQLEKKLEENRILYRQLTKQVEENEGYVRRRLVALYKLNQYGTLPILATSDSIYDLLKRKVYLEHILTHDENIRQKLLEDKTELQSVLALLEAQQREKAQRETELKEEVRGLSKKRNRRKSVLAEIQQKKSLQLAAIDSLKNASAALDQTIERLSQAPEQEITPLGISSFAELKGLLKMPVQGKIVSLFGPQENTRFNVTIFRSGVDIQAAQGASIVAVFSGRVLFADWFKGYGNMMIIDHGESYYTVYAHLEKMRKKKGDPVDSGEAIAVVGETGSVTGPILHFEVRHHGKPLDPLDWIIKS